MHDYMKALYHRFNRSTEQIERLEEQRGHICNCMPCNGCKYIGDCNEGEFAEDVALDKAIQIAKDLASEHNNGWISCSERLPESENKNGWLSCIVSVVRNHYPTSTYDICDAPYDESIVMHANYDVLQKIWHLECDEQLNALIDIEDAPLNGDYIEAWQPLPAPYKKGE